MAAGKTYTPIATHTTTGLVSNYTFTSIPSTYTDLILVGAFAINNPASLNLNVGNNAVDTGTNYSWNYLRGDGTIPSANTSRTINDSRIFSGESNTANLQANIVIHFHNYSNVNTYKTCISRFNQSTKVAQTTVGLWRSDVAINRIRLTAGGSDFTIGSTFTLYGLEAA